MKISWIVRSMVAIMFVAIVGTPQEASVLTNWLIGVLLVSFQTKKGIAMKTLQAIRPIVVVVLVTATVSFAQITSPKNTALVEGQALVQKHEYAKAIQMLSAGLKKTPANLEMKTELGKAYLYNRQDEEAIKTFNEVLAVAPDDKVANLELARALGYRGDYEASNRRYRRLLVLDPGEEQASIGLIRNLIHQKKYPAARKELAAALKAHPDDPRLQELQHRLKTRGGMPEEGTSHSRQMQVSNSFLSDSGGNRFLRSAQSLAYQFTPHISTRLQIEEKRLWRTAFPTSQLFWGTDEIKLRPNSVLGFAVAGGAVRFSNGSMGPLYRGAIEVYPQRNTLLTAGFGRTPFAPTTRAAQFSLASEGWFARIDGAPGPWRFNGGWSHQHLTDSNRSTREDIEALHWFGGRRFAVAAGAHYDHAHYSQIVNHGYFSPNRYDSPLGVAGVRFSVTRHWKAEYLVRVGEEKIDSTPWQAAFEISLHDRLVYRAWELDADYSYYHIAQSAGPYTAHVPKVTFLWHF